MDEALIQNAQHNIDGDDGGEDQQHFVRQRRLERQRRAFELGGDAAGHAGILLRLGDGVDGRAQRITRRKVEGEAGRRELRQMINLQRALALFHRGDRGQRHLSAARRRQIDVLHGHHRILQLGIGFQDHAILVGLGEDGGNDALAEAVIQRIVNRRGRDAEARRGVAVHLEIGGQTLVQERGGDIADRLHLAQLGQQLGNELVQAGAGRGLQHELVLRAAHHRINGQVLHRLQIKGNARHAVRVFFQAVHNRGHAVALVLGLEVDQETAAVERVVGAVHADEAGDAGHRRVGQDLVGQGPLAAGHGVEGDGGAGFGDGLDEACVLQGEEALGNGDVHQHRQHQGAHRHQQGQLLVLQHPDQPAVIAGDNALVIGLGALLEAALAPGVHRMAAQQLGAQHGHERQRHHRRDQDGHRKRDGEFAEQPAHHLLHEQQRDQHRNQRNGQRDDGEADLAGALHGGVVGRLAGFDIARDVLDHHDGIVHHEAGRDRQRHQGQVVERIAQQVHHREGAHDGQRHRQRRNESRRQAAQEDIDHQHHQHDGQDQLELHILDAGADGLGAVSQRLHIHRGGQARLDLGQQLLDRIHQRDDVGARLALDVDQHRRRLVGPAGQLGVLGALHHIGDVPQEHRRAILVGDHDILVGLGVLQLVVGVDGVLLGGAVELALGRVGIVVGDGGAQVVDVQAQRRQPLQVGLHPHGRTLAARDRNQSHIGQLGDLRGDAGVRQVFHRGDRQAAGRHRQRDHRRIGGIDLGVDGRRGQRLGQEVGARIDRRLHFLFSDIEIERQVELKCDDRRAGGRDRRHFLQPRHLAELLFQRRSDRSGHDFRAGAGQEGLHLDGGVIHFRQRRQRQELVAEQAHQQDGDHQKAGRHRPLYEGRGWICAGMRRGAPGCLLRRCQRHFMKLMVRRHRRDGRRRADRCAASAP